MVYEKSFSEQKISYLNGTTSHTNKFNNNNKKKQQQQQWQSQWLVGVAIMSVIAAPAVPTL